MQKGASFVREFNVDNKFGTDVCVYLASIFPNIYTLGMSSYSVHLLHYLFNQRPEILCDRFFYPMETTTNEYPGQNKKNISANRSKLGANFGTPRQRLNSYGHNLPLTDFEVLSFTLQYELDYPNVLYFLSQIDAPLYTDQRITASDLKQGFLRNPLIIAGGPCVRSNPLPMAPFIDFFYTGDLEVILDKFLDSIIKNRKQKEDETFDAKIISDLLSLPGMWTLNKNICQNPTYNKIMGAIYEILSIYNAKNYLEPIISKKQLFEDNLISVPLAKIDGLLHPTRQIQVQFSDPGKELVFGNSAFIEIARGCPNNCKFCMTGAHGKPVRFRSLEEIIRIVDSIKNEMDVNRITFIAPSISDHPKIIEILDYLNQRGIEYSLPSIHIEKIDEKFLDILSKSNIRTITIAPETGNDALRARISKPIKNQTIIENCKKLKDVGIKNIKMYFIVGFPGETEADIESIITFVSEICKLGFDRKSIRCSINCFIPKANTQFENYTQSFQRFNDKKSELAQKINRISKGLAIYPQVEIESENLFDSYLQTLFSTGDTQMSELVMKIFYNNITSFSGLKKLFKEHTLSFDHDEYLKDIASIEPKYLPWKFIRY